MPGAKRCQLQIESAEQRKGRIVANRFSARPIIAGLAWMALGALPAAPTRAQTPVIGGTLVYLEQQAHTNLYPPAGGFYPNGGVLNQITDKLTYQDPKTLEIQPWIAESWTVNPENTEFTF